MATISLSLDRDLTQFVQSQVLAGIATTPEDYMRFLVKNEMRKVKENTSIVGA